MYRIRRVSSHYIVKRKDTTLSIHHCPFWFFYVITARRFFIKRQHAYQMIASQLEKESSPFWTGIDRIVSDSFFIDFSRETEKQETRTASFFQKVGDMMLCAANLRNWLFPQTIFRSWSRQELQLLSVSRTEFISIYGGR